MKDSDDGLMGIAPAPGTCCPDMRLVDGVCTGCGSTWRRKYRPDLDDGPCSTRSATHTCTPDLRLRDGLYAGPDLDDRTPGEQFRAEHPDWPHECCYEPCQHSRRVDGIVRCESPAACDYYCGKRTEAPCAR